MHWHTLHDVKWCIPILILVLLCYRLKILRGLIGILLASVISLVHSHIFVRDINTLFECAEDLTINIQLDSTFRVNLYFANSVVNISKIYACRDTFSGRVLLKVPIELASQMKVGETWKVSARLKPIYGLRNEAGFDAERYYFSQRVQAQAKVTDVLERVAPANLRGRWFERVYQQTMDLQSQPVVLALLFGDRSLINKQQWHNFRQTGLAHLIAISGLHIGLAAMLGWWIGHILRIFCPALICLPIFSAIILASLYAWLAGFSLPTQRALLMCILFSCTWLLGIRLTRWRILWLTLALVLGLSPMSAVSSSLWLSVGAVMVILLALEPSVNKDIDPSLTSNDGLITKRWRIWFKVQLYLSLGLAPISAWILGGIAWLSIAFNAVAVPLVSLYVVPLLLLGILFNTVSEPIGLFMLSLANQGLMLLQNLLTLFESYSLLWLQTSHLQIMLLALLFCVVCLSRWFRVIAVLSLCCVLAMTALTGKQPDWRIDVLDVGHGLAILIQSGDKIVLYDTGAAWDEGSIAQSVIEPIILARGAQLEGVFVSHWDNDHQGGMEYVLQRFLPPYLFTSQKVTPQSNTQSNPCVRGQFWWWQGLSFQVVWPPKTVKRAYNPHSCVVRVTDGQHSALLTGDIDAVAEYHLAHQMIKSDIVIVPHHGSQTSSTSSFVQNVDADVAIASLAKNGRWLLPSPKVVQRYEKLGTQWLDTGEAGQITVHFLNGKTKVTTLRGTQNDAWYRQILRNRVE
nr:DNA internalization-related competence protein ComEC/Rec2 [Vibrio sp. UCD-FRSSP16_10]